MLMGIYFFSLQCSTPWEVDKIESVRKEAEVRDICANCIRSVKKIQPLDTYSNYEVNPVL